MAKQLGFNFTKPGRTAKGRIRKGYRLSACTGKVTKAKPKRKRGRRR